MRHLTRSCPQLLLIIIMLMVAWQSIGAPISDQLLEMETEQVEIERESDEIKETLPEILDINWTLAEDHLIRTRDLFVCFAVLPRRYFFDLAVPDSPPELL